MQQYVLHPGIVTSETEGKSYFVSASTLAYLHGIDIKKCRIEAVLPDLSVSSDNESDIHLYPGWNDKEGGLPVTVTVLSGCDDRSE